MRQHLIFALFVLILIGLVGFLIEFVLLPNNRHLPRDTYLMGWVGYPYNHIDDTDLNSIGLTGDTPETHLSADTVRILTLGGSAIFNRRFTERFKQALSLRTNHPVEVVGAAYRGHTTRSSVIKHDFFSPGFRFDYLIFYHGINDTWANNVDPGEFQADYRHLDAWYRRNWILDNSILARDLYNRFFYRKPERKEGKSAFKSVESFRTNLEHIVRRALDHGTVPILVTFATCVPETYTLKRFLAGEAGYNNPERYDPQPIEGWGPKNLVLQGIRKHNRVTQEVAVKFGVPLLDASVVFGSDPFDFGDVCHFSEPGTDRFAGLLAGFSFRN